jgi:hypothetical protein
MGKCGYTSILRDTLIIRKGNLFIYYGIIVDGLYIITHNLLLLTILF